jgi:hypothetical protein
MRTIALFGLSAFASCTPPAAQEPNLPGSGAQSLSQRYKAVAEARTEALSDAIEPARRVAAPASPIDAGQPLALPGSAARTVVHERVNEAENLFFTEDGRLFVSGSEDIYEIERTPDGQYTRTDYFDEECVVEGIVRQENYLYGVCWTLERDLSTRSFLVAGELTDKPRFRRILELDDGVVPNGMTFDSEGRLYVTYTTVAGQIVRFTFDAPTVVTRKEVWGSELSNVNGIKYHGGAMYITMLSPLLMGQFARVPLRADGSAGETEILYERWFTVLDDVLPFGEGFIISDFLNGTLIFWSPAQGVFAETPTGTFVGPTSIARGKPPMFDASQLLVPEKGTFLIRDEEDGDRLSSYQMPEALWHVAPTPD